MPQTSADLNDPFDFITIKSKSSEAGALNLLHCIDFTMKYQYHWDKSYCSWLNESNDLDHLPISRLIWFVYCY